MTDPRKNPRPQQVWGVYNMGRLWACLATRTAARRWAEETIGKPWPDASEYMEIHKVIVTTGTPDHG